MKFLLTIHLFSLWLLPSHRYLQKCTNMFKQSLFFTNLWTLTKKNQTGEQLNNRQNHENIPENLQERPQEPLERYKIRKHNTYPRVLQHHLKLLFLCSSPHSNAIYRIWAWMKTGNFASINKGNGVVQSVVSHPHLAWSTTLLYEYCVIYKFHGCSLLDLEAAKQGGKVKSVEPSPFRTPGGRGSTGDVC